MSFHTLYFIAILVMSFMGGHAARIQWDDGHKVRAVVLTLGTFAVYTVVTLLFQGV